MESISSDQGSPLIHISQGREFNWAELLEATPDFVASTDPDGKILYLSRGARDMLGLGVEENVNGLKLLDIYPDWAKEIVQNEALPTMVQNGIWEGETAINGAGGVEIPVSQIILAHKTADGDLLYLSTIARDIRPMKEAEEQLLRVQKLESLGFLAGELAHEFNNLLMGILLNVGLAQLQTRDDEVRDLLQRTEAIVSQAKGLSQQLRTLALSGEPVRTTMPLQPLIERAVNKTQHSSSIKIELNLPDDLDEAFADSTQIIHAINNVVVNAVEAMPEGGKISVTARNRIVDASDPIRDITPGKYIMIDIVDDGIGIPPDIKRNLFDPFFTTHPGSSGLGLTSCHNIMKRHGGGITITSTVGSGSTFTLYIPAVDEKNKPKITAIGHDNKSVNILVMDDDAAVRMGLKSLLSMMGNKVTTVNCGEDALHSYQSAIDAGEPYDLVILDLTVPGKMSGSDTMKHLRQIDPEVAGVLSSGYVNDPMMVNYGDHGFKGVLPKPYTHEHLELLLADLTVAV